MVGNCSLDYNIINQEFKDRFTNIVCSMTKKYRLSLESKLDFDPRSFSGLGFASALKLGLLS